jgi:hypothetical protein
MLGQVCRLEGTAAKRVNIDTESGALRLSKEDEELEEDEEEDEDEGWGEEEPEE